MNMYRHHILELYKNPINKGRLVDETHTSTKSNPTCGDKIRISLIASNKIEDIRFSGEGCAISQAAASILTEHVKGKTINEIMKLDGDDMLELLGIEVAPMRLKCAMLALETLKKSLGDKNVRN